MKFIISESQHKRLFEEEQKVLHLPSAKVFGGWDELQRYLELKGNPLYSLAGDLDLSISDIKSLGNLTSVGGNLDLQKTSIKSLGNLISVGGNLGLRNTSIESLGNLTSVGRYLNLDNTPIKSLGNLTSVGGDLDLDGTLISKKYSEEEIRQMVNIGGNIYL